MANLHAAFPSAPLVDDTGQITAPWRSFLLALYTRTGGSPGTDITQIVDNTAELQAAIGAEEAARLAADASLATGLDAEIAARTAGDAANAQAISSEANTRALNDGLLVPRTLLAQLWAGSAVGAYLPRTDPGGGLPWLNGTTISVGSVSTVPNQLELEDASGPWLLEAGGGLVWLWG